LCCLINRAAEDAPFHLRHNNAVSPPLTTVLRHILTNQPPLSVDFSSFLNPKPETQNQHINKKKLTKIKKEMKT
jgi:hypothetical protein